MAMVDDDEWLLAHIRHSFITSDDTGMCEMVIQNNDLHTLEEHRSRLKKKMQAETQNTETNLHSTKSNSPETTDVDTSGSSITTAVARAPSPDILSGWDFGVRRRSNTAQKLERIRKERQNRVKVKTVHWQQVPEQFVSEHLDEMFEKKDVKNKNGLVELKSYQHVSPAFTSETDDSTDGVLCLSNGKKDVKDMIKRQLSESDKGETDFRLRKNAIVSIEGFEIPACLEVDGPNEVDARTILNPKTKVRASTLAKQLKQSVQLTQNPFRDFSKFDGRGHEGTAVTKRINMFVYVYGEEPPKNSILVTVLVAGAKIQDLIGLTCWRYCNEKIEPELKRTDVQGYSLYIAEDDGEVDYGFPALESNEPVSKFSFLTLALVEKHQISGSEETGGNVRESVFVKVNDYAGFSLIQVDNLSVTMGEILNKAIKRRKGNKYLGVYKLEFQDKPGVVVEENQTLDSTGVMEFFMIREHSARSAHDMPKNVSNSEIPDAHGDSKMQLAPVKSVQFAGLSKS